MTTKLLLITPLPDGKGLKLRRYEGKANTETADMHLTEDDDPYTMRAYMEDFRANGWGDNPPPIEPTAAPAA